MEIIFCYVILEKVGSCGNYGWQDFSELYLRQKKDFVNFNFLNHCSLQITLDLTSALVRCVNEAQHSFNWLMQVFMPKLTQWLIIADFSMLFIYLLLNDDRAG